VTLRLEAFSMWLAMALFAGATVLYAYHFFSKRTVLSWYATFLTGAGFLLLTASIGLHSSMAEGSRLYGPYSLVLAAWALVLVYFVVEHLVRLKVYGAVLLPIAVLLLVVAQILGAGRPIVPPPPAELALIDSWGVAFHVALIVFANAGFAIGAAASAAYLGLESQLKRHRTSVLFKRLPSLGQTDAIARRSILIALPVYSAGLLLGVIRAIQTDVAGWWADPRVMLSGVVWLVFALYLYLGQVRGSSGRTTAWVALAGATLVVVVAVMARTVPAGFHVFAVPGR
jgi:ABC-type transport system involved in cytochrome c biogenesis permease subunit